MRSALADADSAKGQLQESQGIVDGLLQALQQLNVELGQKGVPSELQAEVVALSQSAEVLGRSIAAASTFVNGASMYQDSACRVLGSDPSGASASDLPQRDLPSLQEMAAAIQEMQADALRYVFHIRAMHQGVNPASGIILPCRHLRV